MAVVHAENAPAGTAKAGCIECGNPHDVVVFEAQIVDDETGAGGLLVLCTNCVLDAAFVAADGRTKLRGPDWTRSLAS